jgi:hypothetical protein
MDPVPDGPADSPGRTRIAPDAHWGVRGDSLSFPLDPSRSYWKQTSALDDRIPWFQAVTR